MSQTDSRAALVTAFKNGGFFAADKIEWENVSFTPPQGDPWAKFTFVPTQPFVASLGNNGRDQMDAFCQIDLNYPANQGDGAADTKFQAIRSLFTAGRGFTYNGQSSVIVSCGRSQGRNVNGFYRVSVTVVFYAQYNRS